MLPYLVKPGQTGLREWNFTQFGINRQAGGAINGPCQMGSSCTHIPVTRGVCEDNGGTWYGADADPALGLPSSAGFTDCCEVEWWLASKGQPVTMIQPLTGAAVRNDRYKLVRNFTREYVPGSVTMAEACRDTNSDEFYEIDEAVPVPKLDTADSVLDPASFTQEQQAGYQQLSKTLESILASEPECEGDGNGDRVVDTLDVSDHQLMQLLSQGGSSWFDLNLDGVTDLADLAIVTSNLGRTCTVNPP